MLIPFEITSYYRPMTLEIEDEINARSTARFELVDKTGELEIIDGMPIYIYDYDDNLIFGGYTFYPKRYNPIQTTAIFYNVDCIDQQCVTDRYLVAESYLNKSAGFIVNDLLSKYLTDDGITAGTIQEGIILEIVKFARSGTVTDALDQLAEIVGYQWFIDFDKQLYFCERSTLSAGFNVTDTSAIVNVDLRQNRSLYRNRQYIRGGTTPTDSQIVDELPTPKPDSTTRTFVTRYPIAEKPTIKINSVAVSANDIGINGLDGEVTPLKWYYTPNSNTITQDSNETILTASDTIEISYIGLIPLLIVVEDEVAITSRSSIEGNSGIYEQLENLPNVNNKQQAYDIANGKLSKYTKVEREISYETYTNGLSAGQLQNITLSRYNVDNGEFLIDRVTMRDLNDNGVFVYQIHAVDGQGFGGWTNFFKSLLVKTSGLRIDTDERLIVLRAESENEAWTESASYTIYACPVCNTTLICGTGVIVC